MHSVNSEKMRIRFKIEMHGNSILREHEEYLTDTELSDYNSDEEQFAGWKNRNRENFRRYKHMEAKWTQERNKIIRRAEEMHVKNKTALQRFMTGVKLPEDITKLDRY